jgi:putative transposase
LAIFSQGIRQQNPERPIVIVCDNFSSHFADYVDTVVKQLNLTRVALPRYSPDLNPIEQIWRCVKRDLSPLDAVDLDTYRSLITEIFHSCADQLSFAESWIERSLSIQKL